MKNLKQYITNQQELNTYIRFASETMPFDVIGFAQALGIDVQESSTMPSKVSGLIKKNEDDSVVICVNETDSITRKRFTIAHELGHYFRHQDKLKDVLIDMIARDGQCNKIEYEANDFAANLLMPEEEFKACWEDKNMQISGIAEYFYVSESAIVNRAKFLKLIDKDFIYY